jgi:MerR family transcriptional regulator, copper efflux regulator
MFKLTPVDSSEFQIKQVSSASGFSPSTLRYYEQIGLLPPSSRTPAGYRIYSQSTIDRLAFIARAKQLGCTLEEIIDLTMAWAGGECASIQDRLREVVTRKLIDAQTQIDVLATFQAELRDVEKQFDRHRPSGSCDDRCGCVSIPTAQTSVTNSVTNSVTKQVSLSAKPPVAPIPIACTLSSSELPERIHEWQLILSHANSRTNIHKGVRLRLDNTTPLHELMRLIVAERDCCAFFNFTVTMDEDGIAVEITAPSEATELVHELFNARALAQ